MHRLDPANCQHADGFIATSAYYADFMADYLGLPRGKMHVVYPGLNLAGHGGPRPERVGPPAVGYFARIDPAKGLHNLVEAFVVLRKTHGVEAKLRISGWMGANQRPYLDEQFAKLKEAGLADDAEYVDSPTHADKVRFLQSLDVLSVPTTYREPKGLYVLEAMANGVPVVQPRHGSFPELIDATGGGLLVEPNDPSALADGLRKVLTNDGWRGTLAASGKAAVFDRFTAEGMARGTADVLARYADGSGGTRTRTPRGTGF